jgi:hypothetical protein
MVITHRIAATIVILGLRRVGEHVGISRSLLDHLEVYSANGLCSDKNLINPAPWSEFRNFLSSRAIKLA